MGMPITVDVVGASTMRCIDAVFAYFEHVDRRFSTYKTDSEISAINRGDVSRVSDYSDEMREVLALAEQTKHETDGYFDIRKPDGSLDPSGIVKGWAIRNAAAIVRRARCARFLHRCRRRHPGVRARTPTGKDWSVGIRNPFNEDEIIKVVYPRGRGVATSGTYVRGQHIYDPHAPGTPIDDIVSLTVIGPDVLEADRFATAAFAMGQDGIVFIEQTPGLEGYVVDSDGRATLTSGFGALLRAMIKIHRPLSRPHHHVPAGALLPDRAGRRRPSCSASSSWCRTIRSRSPSPRR